MPVAALTSLGRDVRIYHPGLVNIYAAMIGDETRIGPFVEVVGEGSLIGAGAVVTRDVGDYAIMAGNPARVAGDVRQRKRTK
jgi:acetyltransferase-like isoleucine patch superfamily enzyme